MAVKIYKITYHYERGGKVASHTMQDLVSATASTAAAVATVLTSNGKGAPSGSTLVIDSIANGPAALS